MSLRKLKAKAKKKILFKEGEACQEAFLVEEGDVYVSFLGLPEITLKGDGIIVGAIESFLEPLREKPINRLFTLSVEESAPVRSIPFDEIEKMMNDSHFGCNTNIFIAELIENVTGLLAEKGKTPLGLFKNYQRRAADFARSIDRLYDIASRHPMSGLIEILDTYREGEVYTDGSMRKHYQVIEALVSPSDSKSKYVTHFQKNAYLCREGSEAKELFILLKGSVNVTRDKLFVAEIDTPGEVFGEMSFFLQSKRTASLIANDECHVYIIPFTEVKRFADERCKNLFLKIAQALSQRFHDTLVKTEHVLDLLNRAQVGKHDPDIAWSLSHGVDDEFRSLKTSLESLRRKSEDPVFKANISFYVQKL